MDYFAGFLLWYYIVVFKMNSSNWKFITLSAHIWKPIALISMASITKYHSPSSSNNRNVFSYNSGGWKSKTEEPVGFPPSEVPVWHTDRIVS